MNPLQVAKDYAAEEGFDCATNEDGSAHIFHPYGAAMILPDGRVESESNPRLKAVLEKKIAQARAKDAQLLEDPSGRCTIRFSSKYLKMPAQVAGGGVHETIFLAVLKVKRAQLSAEFLEWDTKFADKPGNFPLPSGPEFLVLLLLTSGQLWTTIRAAWPPEKEEYYRSHVGEPVNIEIEGGNV